MSSKYEIVAVYQARQEEIDVFGNNVVEQLSTLLDLKCPTLAMALRIADVVAATRNSSPRIVERCR